MRQASLMARFADGSYRVGKPRDVFDAATLGAAIAEYEAISEILDRASSYGQLLFAANTEDPKVAAFCSTVRSPGCGGRGYSSRRSGPRPCRMARLACASR